MNKNFYFIILLGIFVSSVILYFIHALDIISIISAFVLLVTAYAIATQAFANKEMAENQIKPSVDVSMIFNRDDNGTAFQFLNITKVPAFVWITLKIIKNNKTIEISNEYLNGKKSIDVDVKSWITSSGFLKNLMDGGEALEVTLIVDVAPMFNEKARSFFQKKQYRFDTKRIEWIRTPFWGIGDPIDPRLRQVISEEKVSK